MIVFAEIKITRHCVFNGLVSITRGGRGDQGGEKEGGGGDEDKWKQPQGYCGCCFSCLPTPQQDVSLGDGGDDLIVFLRPLLEGELTHFQEKY